MWSSLAFAACLIAVSAVMLVRQRQAWRTRVVGDLAKREREYLEGQYRRRMQASTLIGVVGLAVIGGLWVRDPRLLLLYWMGVCLLVLWMGCLALADLFSTQIYYRSVRRDYAREHQALNAELEKLRRRQSNGRQVAEPLPHEEDN